MTEHEYILFECIGEVSKDIMATAVVGSLKRENPDSKIIITTLHPEVWLHNPSVHRVYRTDAAPYFYEDYILPGNAKIYKLDPYNQTDYISGETHLIDSWHDLVSSSSKERRMDLVFTQRELEVTHNLLRTGKPVFMFQTDGEVGGIPYPTTWSREIRRETANEIVRAMLSKGYRVLQITGRDDMLVSGAERLTLENRLLMCAVLFADKRLFIDSFPQHAAAAFGKQSVVLWNTHTEKSQGYAIHTNIHPMQPLDPAAVAYIETFRATKILPKQAPFNLKAPLYDTHKILDALESQQV